MIQRLDTTCHLPIGTRDAAHVPFVVAIAEQVSLKERIDNGCEMKPGSYVHFTNSDFTRFVLCGKEFAHGVLNPFIDSIAYYDAVVVFLMPGITTTVRHSFAIDPAMRDTEAKYLDSKLEAAKREDPDCAGCYEIRNNEIVRN